MLGIEAQNTSFVDCKTKKIKLTTCHVVDDIQAYLNFYVYKKEKLINVPIKFQLKNINLKTILDILIKLKMTKFKDFNSSESIQTSHYFMNTKRTFISKSTKR